MPKLVIREPGKPLREFQLEKGPYTLGRDEENDIVVSDETVSRKHARIKFENGSFIIEDLKSTSGVYVNRKKIEGECKVNPGDDILIGSTEIAIEEEKTDDDKTKLLSPEALQKYIEGTDKTQILDTDVPGIPKYGAEEGRAEDERTRMLDAEEVHIAEQQTVMPYHRFLVISKKGFGKEYLVDRSEITVGRSGDSSIMLDDQTVSSIHATIRMEGNDCVLRDMNSKNGTFVNGSPIREEYVLQEGDEIKIGSFKLKFIHKDTVISREALLLEVKRKEKKHLINKALIGGLALLCIVIVLVAVSRETKEPEKRPAIQVQQPGTDMMEPLVPEKPPLETQEKPPAPVVLGESMADIYFNTANEFLANRLWDEAIGKFEQVQRIDPDYPGVPDGIFHAKIESLNRSLLEEGLLLISQGHYTEGIKQLEGISQESIYINEAMLEIQFARDEMAQAKKKEATGVRKRTQQPPQMSSLNEKGEKLIDQALKYYADGNTKAAMTKLNAALKLKISPEDPLKIKASSLKESMARIAEVYDKGLAEYNSRQFGQAFQSWSEVLDIDQEIIGQGKSHFSSTIAIYMADEFYRQAREAYEKEQYIEAYAKCTKALKASPGHRGCLEIKGLLAEKAKRLYEDGYILEELNPTQAIQKWKMVLEMCPPENEYYQKAKSRIAKYE
jgi:pSer/pThr/pTyr-binding forkhead associated (FHA) protein